jgi:manganese efflux pump family protein
VSIRWLETLGAGNQHRLPQRREANPSPLSFARPCGGRHGTLTAMVVKLIALVLPLGLDTFAVSAALGLGGLSRQRRLRTSLLFTAFEAGMPLIGLAIGRPLGSTIGNAADYVAIGVLFALAIHMLLEHEDGTELSSLLDGGVRASVALGVSISLDELAIGFTLGLLGVPVVPVIVLIAVQTFVVTHVGMRIGQRIGERARRGAERLGGVAFGLLATGLLIANLTR